MGGVSKMLVPKRVRIEREIIVRIYRTLTGKGKLSVSKGQEVTPEEIIGKGEFSGGFTTLNISDLLSVSAEDAQKALKKTLGQKIYKGELVAYKSGGFLRKPKFITCPTDGILDFINKKTGEIRITRMPQKVDLPAGVYGVVEEVDDSLGKVLIRTQVSRVWGVCGSGRTRDGTLQILSKRDELIGKSRVPVVGEGNILLNGGLISKESIMVAISNGVSGIITGGIGAQDYKSVAGGKLVFPKRLENDIGVSIIVCEGFGSEPIGEDIYEILSSYKDRFVTIDGNHAFLNLPSFESDCMIKIRKTNLPKIEMESSRENDFVELGVGQKVRVVGTSYAAEQGKVIAVDRSKTLLPSVIWSFLTVISAKRRKIRVPTANIEVID